ncbi:MMPL family transporter [Nostocoides sp.]|uniref:MMPL family transporter n=1 Tax=Nostocoides sp. TaxID=1917966 RepID=UPI002CF91CD8|nr:MMPL family transporter [Tetrasphaera sp.]
MSRLTALPIITARWSATHPWRAIGAWFAFVALAVALASAIPTQAATEADYRIGESGRADALLSGAGIRDPLAESVLITARDGTNPDREQVARAAAQLTAAMTQTPGVASVAPLVWSADGSAALVSVAVSPTADDAAPLLATTRSVAQDFDSLRIEQSGDLSIDAGINDRVASDLKTAEFISLPVTLVLMLLAFGALIAAGVPVLLAATSVAATMGLAAPISYLIPAEPTVNSMIVLIGMAVGVDYSLFYLKREREERAKGASTLDAVAIAARTSGHAILVSGGAVIVSMAGLYLIGAATFNSLATGSIVVVAVAVLGSITVLPALLVKLGRWVDRPRIPLLWRLTRRMGRGAISGRLLAPVLRFPRLSLVAALAATGALAVPAFGMSIHTANLTTLPGDIPAVATITRIADAFPSEGTSALVAVRGSALDQPDVEQALRDLSARAAATPLFTDLGVDPVRVSTDRTVTRLELAIPYPDHDPRAAEAISSLRESLAPAALDGLDAEYAVGGWSATGMDFADRQSDRMPLVIGFVMLLTLVMMIGVFRSVALALVSTALNLLSVGVAFGVLRLIFQDGHLEGLLGFTSPGFIIDWIPLFVMTILVGLSMDYHVFVLSRVREYAQAGLSAREAVRRGIGDTASVVTSAAAVMVSVFAIFATLSLMEMKMMGVGLAVAILLDATIIRLVILPATLVLLGERIWHRPTARAVGRPGPLAQPQLVGTAR